MMYGTIFQMRPRSGQEKLVEEMFHRWQSERGSKVSGFVNTYLFKSRTNSGQIIAVAVFDSEATYRKNSDDAEQDRWYKELRALLEADPEWNDGDVMAFPGKAEVK